MIILGYVLSILIGVSLGLIGGGGSILTVPLLVYLFKIDAVIATSYSLFIVGISSSVGTINYFKKKLVDIKTAFLFGIPSIVSVYFTKAILVPSIPAQLFVINEFTLTKNMFIMLLFSIIMIASSYTMLRKNKITKTKTGNTHTIFAIFIGLIIGLITGMVGAGGGFIIIPALVLFFKLPMKSAIGTSLFIITINSAVGFSSQLYKVQIDWQLLFLITFLSVIGIFIGTYLSNKIDGEKLKPVFGWFVLIMGLLILFKEIN